MQNQNTFSQLEIEESVTKKSLFSEILPSTLNVDFLKDKRPTVAVIIPTLNEAKNLPLVLPYLPMNWIDEVILVDGRSTDNTVEIAKRLLPSIKVVMETTLYSTFRHLRGFNDDVASVCDFSVFFCVFLIFLLSIKKTIN